MTPEELDEARATEVLRRLVNSGPVVGAREVAALGARLAREGWTPPEPVVDPDVLAWREWLAGHNPAPSKRILINRGHYDNDLEAIAYRAGAAAFAERIKALEEALREVADDLEAEIKARAGGELPRRVERDLEPVFRARDIIAKYRGEA